MTYLPKASALPVTWTKALASDPNENCVECANLAGNIAIRDSKDPHGPAHVYPVSVFGAFLAAVSDDALVPVA
ncbi:DUF397 domain-containing protein [Kitasatospora sp. NPDC098663]|uniref:DUF397 domain-containing protein n=1 Tax=Kitasatospora sp. NPDC098663 TaxID=3364096 RepID=UPI0037FF18F0